MSKRCMNTSTVGIPTTSMSKQTVTTSGDTSLVVLSFALKLVSQGGFLHVKDVGHLWLLTCKELTINAFEGGPTSDELWRILLESHLGPSTTKLILQVTSKKAPAASTVDNNITIKDRFLAMIPQPEPQFVVPKLQYQPSDYIFLLYVWKFDPLCSSDDDFARQIAQRKDHFLHKAVLGQDIPGFFDNGKGGLKFDKPLCCAEEECPDDEVWTWTLDLLRLPDNNLIPGLCRGGRACSVAEKMCSRKPAQKMTSTLLDQYCGHPLAEFHRLVFVSAFQYNFLETTTTTITDGVLKDLQLGIFGIRFMAFIQSIQDDGDTKMSCVSNKLNKEQPGLSFAHVLESLLIWKES